MKKVCCILLAALVLLSVSACGHAHAYGEWTTVTEAGCTTAGLRERSCECGEKETETIAPVGHSYAEPTVLTQNTCTEDGKVEKLCSVCGEKTTEVVTAPGHSFKAATAYAPKTCSVCGLQEGQALSRVVAVGDSIEAADHSFVVEKQEFTGALKERRGNITYNYGGDGYVLAIKLNFTNLATDAFERWSSDRIGEVTLQYGGKYNYEGEYWCPGDDIVALDSGSVYIVYTVPKSMSDDESSALYAAFSIDGEAYSMVIRQGNGTVTEQNQEKELTQTLSVGDTRSDGENFAFTLKDVYYTDKPSEKQGNVTHSLNTDGRSLVLKLSFTNYAAETMDDWNTDRIADMKLIYADKYDYEGRCWIPIDEIVPLADGNLYIVYEISDVVEDSTDPLVASFTIDGKTFTVDCRAQ